MLIRENKIYAVGTVLPGAKLQWGVIPQTGSRYLRIPVEVTEGPYTGYKRHYDAFFTEKSIEFSFDALRVMGWQGDDLEKLQAEDLSNAFDMTIERDKDKEGKPSKYHKVAWINRRTRVQSVKAVLLDTDLRQLSAQLRSRAASVRKESLVPYERPDPATQPGPSTTGAHNEEYQQEASDYGEPAAEYRDGDYGEFQPPAYGYNDATDPKGDIPF